jgi:hypothetical protein
MKAYTTFATLLLALLLIGTESIAQVRVTGHVFAEIVEAVGATSATSNSLQIQQNAVSNNFDLGEISISGGSNAACAVMITASDLKGINGSEAAFSALPESSTMPSSLDQNGRQIIKLQGVAGNEIMANSDKAYAAQYNVVFAYN